MEPYEIIMSPFEVYVAPVGTTFPAPELPQELVTKAREKYLQALRMITVDVI